MMNDRKFVVCRY